MPDINKIKLKSKDIIIVGTAYPFRGGLAAYNERLASEFQKEGNKVTIYTFIIQYPNFLFPGKSQYASWESPENLNIQVKVNSINPLNWIKIGLEIKKLKPDIVIFKYWIPFMSPCFGSIARIVKKNKKTKIITIVDNIIPHEKRPGDKFLTKYFCKSVDAFIAMSKSVIEEINIFDNSKPKKYCPHPLFDNFGDIISKKNAIKQLGLSEAFNYLLFFGFIRAYKGLDLLLQAFADERLKKYPYKLIIAGEFYEDSKPYIEIIEKLNLNERVILHNNFIPDNKVAEYFCSSDLVVQPYKNATQSGVTQICYHFNKPMLVTNVGGLPEIVPNNKVGYVINPDSNSIAEKLLDFFETSKEEYFVQNILEEKKKFMWNRMTSTIEETYNILQNDNKK